MLSWQQLLIIMFGKLKRSVTEEDYDWLVKKMVRIASDHLGEYYGAHITKDVYFVDFMR